VRVGGWMDVYVHGRAWCVPVCAHTHMRACQTSPVLTLFTRRAYTLPRRLMCCITLP